MSYTLTSEEQISMWIVNVRDRLRSGDVQAALTFLDTLESDWEKYQQGEMIGPMTILTGNKMLIAHFEGQSAQEVDQ